MRLFNNFWKFFIILVLSLMLVSSVSGWSTSNMGNVIVRGYANINGTEGMNVSHGDLTINDGEIYAEKNITTGQWFKGKFNWTSLSRFLPFDGSSLDFDSDEFNTTYDDRFYNQSDADDNFVDVSGDTMTGNLTLNGDANLNAISYTDANETFWNLKANPSSESGGTLFLIEADGSNWASGSKVLHITSDDASAIPIRVEPSTTSSIGLQIIGKLRTGNIEFDTSREISTLSGTDGNITLIPDGNGFVKVGDAGEQNRLTPANDDLFVSGKLEVDGNAYFDGISYFYEDLHITDNDRIEFGNANDASLGWLTAQTPDTLFMGLSSASRSFIIGEEGDESTDFAQPLKDNPTLFIQSSNESDIDEFMSIEHDQTDARLTSGQGDLRLSSAEGVNVDGDLKMGDEDNYKLLDVYANGTNIVFDSNYALPFYFDNAGISVQNITTNDFIKIQANTSAVTCTEGVIYYDGTDNVHKACNGSAVWNNLY